ncbi:hypothetical protein EE612_027772, partial [Oryza sativa]
ASHLPAAVLSSPIQNRVFEHPPCSFPAGDCDPPHLLSSRRPCPQISRAMD